MTLSSKRRDQRRQQGETRTTTTSSVVKKFYSIMILSMLTATFFSGKQRRLPRTSSLWVSASPRPSSNVAFAAMSIRQRQQVLQQGTSSQSFLTARPPSTSSSALPPLQSRRPRVNKMTFWRKDQHQKRFSSMLFSPSSSSSCLFASSGQVSNDDGSDDDDDSKSDTYWESGRAFKSFAESEEMAYDYDPSEYDVVIPSDADDDIFGPDSSLSNDNHSGGAMMMGASIYDDELPRPPPIRERSSKSNKAPPSTSTASTTIVNFTGRSQSMPAKSQPNQSENNVMRSSQSNSKNNSNNNQRQTRKYPPPQTRRNNNWGGGGGSYDNTWASREPEPEKKKEEIDLTDWHPHTAYLDPVPIVKDDKNDNSSKDDSIGTIARGEDSSDEGNVASTIKPPVRQQGTTSKQPIGKNSIGGNSTTIAPPMRRRQEEVTKAPPSPLPAQKEAPSPAPKRKAPVLTRTSGYTKDGSTPTSKRNNPTRSVQQRTFSSSAFPGDDSGPPALSRDEFRARFASDAISESTTTTAERENRFPKEGEVRRRVPPPSSSSSYPNNRRNSDDTVYMLECEIQRLEDAIKAANNGTAFNLKSFKQISMVLFGKPNESTSKDALETLAMQNNEMAKLILEHRQKSQKLTKVQNLKKKQSNKAKLFEHNSKTNPATDIAAASATAPNAKSSSSGDNNVVLQPTTEVADPLLLVDTSSLIFRAYYSMPPIHRSSDGMPIAAVLGFCNMINSLILNKLLRGERPRLILCCDPTGKTFRHQMYADYKAHRPEAPMDLIPQFELIREAARAYGMLQVQATGYEADDVIATLSRQALKENKSVNILSIDKDLWQLVTKPNGVEDDNGDRKGGARIEMLDPVTMTQVTHELVEEKWGVPPEQLGDVLALAGDAADNIPGVPGIGPKIAAKLISEYGNLDNLLAKSVEIPQKKRRESLQANAEQAKLSQMLVRLEHEIKVEDLELDPPSEGNTDATNMTITDRRMEPFDPDRVLAFYDEMGFVTIKKRLLDRLQTQKTIPFKNQMEPSSSSDGQRNKVGKRASANGASTSRTKKFAAPRQGKTGIPEPEDFKDVPF